MKRVLILEDVLDLCMQWKTELEASGYEVVAVTDPDAAIEELEHSTFDLVIADILMRSSSGVPIPRGGFTLLSHLILHVNPRPQVLAVSGANFDVLTHATTMKANRILQKPFDVGKLIGVVGEMIGSSE